MGFAVEDRYVCLPTFTTLKAYCSTFDQLQQSDNLTMRCNGPQTGHSVRHSLLVKRESLLMPT